MKAEIFYNHLYFNNVPWRYVQEIINQELLFTIIEHENYNPRIIESFTKQKIWEKCAKEDFPRKIVELFDNPVAVWEHAFENNITDEARIIMYVFLMNNQQTSYKELYEAVMRFSNKFAEKYNVKFNDLQFKKAIKELENTFVSIEKRDNKRIVDFQNPSIQDFLIQYVDTQESLKADLINNTKYIDLTLKNFSQKSKTNSPKLSLTSTLSDTLTNKIISDFNNLTYRKTRYLFHKDETRADINLQKLKIINGYDSFTDNITIQKFIAKKLSQIMTVTSEVEYEVNSYFELTRAYYNLLNCDFRLLLKNSVNMIQDYTELFEFLEYREIDNKIYDDFLYEHESVIEEIIYMIIDDVFQGSDADNFYESISILSEIQDIFNIDTYDERRKLEERFNEEEYKQNDDYQPYQSFSDLNHTLENKQIISMFQSYQ